MSSALARTTASPETLERIYHNFRDPLRAFLTRQSNDPHVAEDLLHEVFLRVHDGLGGLRDVDKLESWIYQIARNAITDARRRVRANIEIDESVPANGDEAHDVMAELSLSVESLLHCIPEPYREAVRLADLRGTTHRELASRLGISVSGVKSRVQRGRRMLLDAFRQCCHLEFDSRGRLMDYSCRVDCPHCPPASECGEGGCGG